MEEFLVDSDREHSAELRRHSQGNYLNESSGVGTELRVVPALKSVYLGGLCSIYNINDPGWLMHNASWLMSGMPKGSPKTIHVVP